MTVPFTYHDGGRAEAGFKGKTADCVVRAVALATRRDYKTVYDELQARQKEYVATTRKKAVKARKNHSVREGVWPDVYKPYLAEAGAEWVPLAAIGATPVRVYQVAQRWPDRDLIMNLARHITAMRQGRQFDLWEQHPEKRVYGVWLMPVAVEE